MEGNRELGRKCSRVPAQQEHAGPESQAGVAEALPCPLGAVVEKVPCQGPSCEHPMVLGTLTKSLSLPSPLPTQGLAPFH